MYQSVRTVHITKSQGYQSVGAYNPERQTFDRLVDI
jgi:hypothetical protein